jgi:tRNA A-37 threonylcarbamoyl transferase component Bud32
VKICLSCEGVAATEQQKCAHCGVPLLPLSAVHYPRRRGEADAANPMLGRVLDGKYLLQGVLGRGGMGTVFFGCHAVSLVPVALKLLHPRLSSRREYRRALLGEARKAGRVVHEHCARILDVGETEDGAVYLAMELVDGETIDQLVMDGGVLPEVAVTILEQVCHALSAIHGADLVHRDLSSRNVMVAKRSGGAFVKVLDFGIAQPRSGMARAGDSSHGESAFANPVFSAPEHLAGHNVDARADIYSLGVLAYLLLTGGLPVEERDAQQAMRATIEGRLRPLPTRSGVPRRLSRLVEGCLQTDPARRPASARAVQDELQRIRRGRFPALPRLSVALLAALTVVASIVVPGGIQPFLQLGGDLALVEGALPVEAPVRHMTSASLASVRGHCGGFAADRLQVELVRDGVLLYQRRLAPEVDQEGALVLADAQPEWRSVVAGVAQASARGAVDLVFLLPQRAWLGSARIRIDDVPPRISASLEHDGQVLRADSLLRFEVEESVGLDRLEVSVECEGGMRLERRLDIGQRSVEIGRLLAAEHGGMLARGGGTIALFATDLAGNVAPRSVVSFDRCDLGVPRVTEVTGRLGAVGVIDHVSDKAVMRVGLDGVEPGARLAVLDQEGQPVAIEPSLLPEGRSVEIELLHVASGEEFADGVYRFVVEDAAGNRSESVLPLRFRSGSAAPLQWTAVEGAVVLVDEEVVTTTDGCHLQLKGNPAFRLSAARLAGGAALQVEDHGEGRSTVWLPPSRPSSTRMTLEFEHRDRPGEVVERMSRAWRTLPEQLQVHVPDVRVRFLPGLIAAGLLVLDEENAEIIDGRGVVVEGDLRAYVRGSVWFGADPTSLAPMPLAEGDVLSRQLLRPTPVRPGRNVLAVELTDVLGRPVAVVAGSGERLPVETDSRVIRLADFWLPRGAPQQVGEEVRVEYGQDATLRLRSDAPFGVEERGQIRLAVGAEEFPARSVRALAANASELEFGLSFDALSSLRQLADLPRERYVEHVRARLETRLITPAGNWELEIALRTVRTTLRIVELAEIGGGRPQPEELAAMRLLPVLAPASGTFSDPVPATAPGRATFRPQSEQQVVVRDDIYLQDRELSVSQYDAVSRWATSTGQVHARIASIVHAHDPMGGDRLTVGGLLPVGMTRRQYELQLAEAPDSAVVAVGFYQAWAVSRLLGLLVGDDCELFRLPLGVELELAALADAEDGFANGAAARGEGVSARMFARSVDATWPWSFADCAAAGDSVPSAFGSPFVGLDFGVREWVLDLPPVDVSRDLLTEWVTDQRRHVQRALAFAAGDPVPAELRLRLRRDGVVRGLPAGDVAGLLDATGRPLDLAALLSADSRLPASVPGVVRSETLSRVGRGLLPGTIDRRFARVGFRLVGDAALVRKVRGQ